MKNTPWYIWLSTPMFVYLSGYASRRISALERKASNSNDKWKVNGLWFRVVGITVLLAFVFVIILPMTIIIVILSFLEEIIEMPYNEFLGFIPLFILYMFGVYATYKYDAWIRKNLPKNLEISDLQ